MTLAEQTGIRSIAFPAISTGVYGFPALQAARIAVNTVRRRVADGTTLEKIVFCCLQTEIAEFHQRFLDVV
jgi:O-acetyl-ADP-ribose deacetylase (regulator of RNase III)